MSGQTILKGAAITLGFCVLFAIIVFLGFKGAIGPQGPAGAQGVQGVQGLTGTAGKDATVACQACHNNSTLISEKELQYDQSVHLTGDVWDTENQTSCIACHDGQPFVDALTAGLFSTGKAPTVTAQAGAAPGAAYISTTPIDCTTCHNIHTTYTSADFSLRTTAPVKLYAVPGAVYDKGASNLCANCHQPRSVAPAVGAPPVTTSIHYEPMGPQAGVMLGVGGYNTAQIISIHYGPAGPADGCVTCHMAPSNTSGVGGHSLNMNNTAGTAPDVTACQAPACHGANQTTFDVDGVQTKVKALYAQLQTKLIKDGLLASDGVTEIAGTFPSAYAGALFNWEIVKTDGSWGVHNPAYIVALLNAGLAAIP